VASWSAVGDEEKQVVRRYVDVGKEAVFMPRRGLAPGTSTSSKSSATPAFLITH